MAESVDNLTILGKVVRTPTKKLESFLTPPGVTYVKLTNTEFTSLCPITGQPDYGVIDVEYIPDQLCVESKSLKLYCWSFREEGAFCERLSSIIARDIFEALQPHKIAVTVHMASRGGISIDSTCELVK